MQPLSQHTYAEHFTIHNCHFHLTINYRLFHSSLVANSPVTSTSGSLIAGVHIYSSTCSSEFSQPLPVPSTYIRIHENLRRAYGLLVVTWGCGGRGVIRACMRCPVTTPWNWLTSQQHMWHVVLGLIMLMRIIQNPWLNSSIGIMEHLRVLIFCHLS
jgi:hypothetical protein